MQRRHQMRDWEQLAAAHVSAAAGVFLPSSAHAAARTLTQPVHGCSLAGHTADAVAAHMAPSITVRITLHFLSCQARQELPAPDMEQLMSITELFGCRAGECAAYARPCKYLWSSDNSRLHCACRVLLSSGQIRLRQPSFARQRTAIRSRKAGQTLDRLLRSHSRMRGRRTTSTQQTPGLRASHRSILPRCWALRLAVQHPQRLCRS